MRELRVAIIDDEPLVRQGIREHLSSEAGVVVVGEARDGSEAVELLRACRPDVAFLDVQMPVLDGFAVLEKLDGTPLPAIVFVTAFDAYALRAFDVHAVDYLLKPFDEERFRIALARVRTRIDALRPQTDHDDAADPRAALIAAIEEIRARHRYTSRLLVRHDDSTIVVPVETVDWIEAYDNYVRLHVGPARHLMRESIATMAEQLDPQQFARVHRSAIVNLSRVREIQPTFNGESTIILSTGAKITLSRTYREAFRARLRGAASR